MTKKINFLINAFEKWFEEQDYYYLNDSEQIKSMDCLTYDEEHSEEDCWMSFAEEKGYSEEYIRRMVKFND